MKEDKRKDVTSDTANKTANTTNEPNEVEVDELDEKSLEGAAGGTERQIDDINQLQCYC